jgi:selenocysteine lyase/cysteine desulfurase
MDRRKFLIQSGLAVGAGAILKPFQINAYPLTLDNWTDVRAQFNLAPDRINMALMLLASHPKIVADTIEHHRKNFDKDPVTYWEENALQQDERVKKAAADYINAMPDEIAVTDSTTMGLAILYCGLKLNENDQILTTVHDHYSTEKSLSHAAGRNGAAIKRIKLCQNPAEISIDEVIANLKNGFSAKTRIVAVTWVHSSTGVKLPLKEMAALIREENNKRTEKNRIYFCVDGVHGFGIEDINIADLGCDFFVAGTHKWLFGPRGTGILFAKKDAWNMVSPTIPAFSFNAYSEWLDLFPKENLTFSDLHTPGGFHSFDHRWALPEAFNLHLTMGKAKVQERTHFLSSKLKEALKNIKHITLHTPVSADLSAGINCFEVKGISADEVVKKLHQKHIIASSSPYKTSYARLTPCIINTEEEVLTCIKELENIL